MKYAIYYKKEPTFHDDKNLSWDNYLKTHTFLRFLEAKDLDNVFYKMQGEVWSPNGEARDLIRSCGLRHTSMSVGDLICDLETMEMYEVGMEGFNLVKGSGPANCDIIIENDLTPDPLNWCNGR
jgi:hypothetical protein